MEIEEQKVILDGRTLHRLILNPTNPPCGTLVFFHGQGDFIDRYPPLLSAFVDQGVRCILTDLPGHGRSEGRRGNVPGFAFLNQLLQSSLEGQPGPHFIAGHSAGGLLALRFFLNEPARFAAAWFSSPLLHPMGQARPWMRILLPVIATLFPWITVSTGVRTEDCTDEPGGRQTDDDAPLYHNKISIGWGLNLRDAAREIEQQFPAFPGETPALFTQGEVDNICPPSILRSWIAKLSRHQITYLEIEDARHEPFQGSTADHFQTKLAEWVETVMRK